MAYAAVICLKHTIKGLKNHINPQITKSAYAELKTLRSLLKRLDGGRHRGIDRSVIHQLEAKIRDAVRKVEDVLESYAISQGVVVDEKVVDQEIDLFLKTVKMLKEEYKRELQQKPLPAEEEEEEEEEEDTAVPAIYMHKSTTVIGLADLSEKVMNDLRDTTRGLRAVSLVGMAGIGKTHLATQIFHHPIIVQHFDSRLWVRVGSKHREMKSILVDILAQIKSKPRNFFKGRGRFSLKQLFQQSLSGLRFLIVLDDIWSIRVLDYLIAYLPEYRNGSRFLLTTRQEEVAKYHARDKFHQMPFLNDEESWNLFWQNVFGTEEYSFPYRLEKAGRKIAEMCEGLPLLILAVASILCVQEKTEEYWEKVAEKKTSTFTDAYDQIYHVLLPSYEYLPQRLKPCFLYMGVFPQTCEIPLSKLINLWTVEDFLEPINNTWTIAHFLEPTENENLEERVMKSMEELVSKSLAIVCKRRYERGRRIKSSKLHCVYWYLCVTEARKNKFFHVLIKLTDVISMERPRRLSVQNNILFGIKEVYASMAADTSPTARSLLFTGEDHQYPVRVCLNMMLLKVLDALSIRFYEFPEEVLKLLRLRYLSLTHNGELPPSISKLQQLHYMILRRHHNIKLLRRDPSCLPEQIWDMQELRHLRIMGSKLPDPSEGAELPKLLTLYVNADSCSKDIFRSIPNLKKLGIKIELQPDTAAETIRCLGHICLLKRLESLKCVVMNPFKIVVALPDHLSNLPRSLKKLSLKGLGYSWKYMSVIGSLPKLKVLKLRCSAFQGPEWETEVKKFNSLQFLLLEDIDLMHWTAQDSFFDKCFPNLRHLIVRHCYKLKKIPLEIGEISTLRRMEVDDCSPAAVDSAQHIEKKRSSLQVVINSSWKL